MEKGRSWTPVESVPGAPPPAGAYTPAVRTGGLVFVSGQVPKDPHTGAVVGATVAEQTRQVLANAERALNAAGATLDDVVAVTVYLATMDDWAAFDAVYREILRPPYPTRTTVGADLRGFMVEISMIASVRA